MEFNEFVKRIVDEIPDYLLQYDIDNIHVEKVNKNNGVVCTGMVIVLQGEHISPNIYLDYYYRLYSDGKTIDEILGMIGDEYKEARNRLKHENIDISMDIETIKKNIFIKLINYERNKELFKDSPYIPFLDLAVCFRYLVKHNESGIASAIVRNSDLEKWKINIDELYELAKENTLRIFPPNLKRLDILLKEVVPDDLDIPEDTQLYVLTNLQGINGASYLLFDEIIKKFAKEKNSNLFILPSSIHEVLLLPETQEFNKDELANMVQDINKYVVSDMDFLSDNVYFYNLNDCNISV